MIYDTVAILYYLDDGRQHHPFGKYSDSCNAIVSSCIPYPRPSLGQPLLSTFGPFVVGSHPRLGGPGAAAEGLKTPEGPPRTQPESMESPAKLEALGACPW